MFFLILIAVIGFIVRVYPRLAAKDMGVDSFYYLIYTDSFRNQRRLPVIMDNYILDIKEQWYPPMTSMIASFIPKRFFDKLYWVFNPLVDSMQLVLFYFAAFFISNNELIALTVALLYALSPIAITQSSNFNSRILGSLFSFLAMANFLGYFVTQKPVFLILSIFFITILLITHKLAIQQMIFYVLALTIFLKSPLYLLSILTAVLFAIVFTKGFYIKVFRGHFEIINFWRKNLTNLYAHQIYASDLYRNKEKEKQKKGVYGIRGSRFSKIITEALYLLVFLLPLVFFIKACGSSFYSNGLMFIFLWVFIGYFTVIITAYLPVFKWLGEGFKYLLYLSFPAYYLVSFFLIEYGKLNTIFFMALCIILLLSAISVFYINKRQLKNTNAIVEKELFEIFEILKNNPSDNIMAFPVTKAEAIAYFTGKKVLWGGHGSNWGEFGEFFPVLKKPIEYFVEKYKIGLILIDKRFVDLEDLRLKFGFEVLIEKGSYIVLKVKKNAQ